MPVIKCPAKINLFLHVLGKNYRGYHDLESLVMFAEDLYDELTISESHDNRIEVGGKWHSTLSGKNTLQVALEKLSYFVDNKKFHIKLIKNIPIGAGLGGGSSNAAALIKYLIETLKLPLSTKDVIRLLAEVGADCPMFYYGKSLYFNGIGEVISLVESMPPLWGVVLYPNAFTLTRSIFAMGFDKYRDRISRQYNFKTTEDVFEYLKNTTNDLYKNTISLVPHIEKVLEEISNVQGCKFARMSGSGSTCFGLFDNAKQAKQGLDYLQKKFPSYAIYVTQLR